MVKTENISGSTGFNGNSDDSFFLGYAIGKKKGGGGDIRGNFSVYYTNKLYDDSPIVGELVE